jgi:hypothetical protein
MAGMVGAPRGSRPSVPRDRCYVNGCQPVACLKRAFDTRHERSPRCRRHAASRLPENRESPAPCQGRLQDESVERQLKMLGSEVVRVADHFRVEESPDHAVECQKASERIAAAA